MATYLLAWNPKRWPWKGDMSEAIRRIDEEGSVVRRWSCGKSTQIRKGDRLFIIRLGEEPRGIFASGEAETDWYEDLHWNEAKAREGEKAHFVKVRLDTLLHPGKDPILARTVLDTPPFSDQHWDTQLSGIRIHDVASELEKKWAQYLYLKTPQETSGAEAYPEGATRRITVNAYERNRKAAKRCVDHYGYDCRACGFDFAGVYGEIGEGFIHVHHLKPLSEIRSEYRVDPIRDLRPVCPNCHAMIHKRNPVYSIEELRDVLSHSRAEKGNAEQR